jgi:hypothetical protein
MKNSFAIFIASCILIFSVITGCGEKKTDNKTLQKESEIKKETQKNESVPKQNNSSTSESGKVWSKIDQINSTMGKSINSANPGHLEEPVAEILNLLKTLPDLSPEITGASLETLKSKANELRKIGMSMDKYQHGNNIPELKEEYVKFKKTLEELKSELPK